MRLNRIAMVMLAAGFAVGVAQAQSDPYGRPGSSGEGPQGQYGPQGQGYDPGQYQDDWREGDDWYERQSHDGYDRNGYDGYDGSGGYDDYGGRDERYQPPSVEVGFFYNELSPYGEWVRHPYYGWVWFPRNVHAGWRPYSVGRWVLSDYGWTWVSYERFGWATYHYGRWAWDRYVGWLWVPGTDWGPAWVAWQQGNGYIGWAPLPPAVGFDVRVGIQLGGFNLSFGIAPRNYAFVEERRFLDNRIGGYIVPEARNVTIIHNTTNITNYTVVDNRVINRGVPVERVERVTGKRARRLRVATASAPSSNVIEQDVVRIYRPAETKLESVKVAKRNNAGLRKVAAPEKAPRAQAPGGAPAQRPPAASAERKPSAKVPIAVAPRVQTAPQKVNEKQFAREQQELKANQQKQQQAVEQMQRREKAQVEQKADRRSDNKGVAAAETQEAAKEKKGQASSKAQAAPKIDAQEVQKRHAAERAEQQLLREREAAQLQNRQQIQRQAAEASAAKAKGQGKAPQATTEEAKPPKGGKGQKGKAQAEEEEQKQKKAKGQKQTSSNEGEKPPQSF